MFLFDSILSIEKNSFNETWNIRVCFINNGIKESRFIKFQSKPNTKQITKKIQDLIDIWNTPEPVETFRNQIQEKVIRRQELFSEITDLKLKITNRGEIA